MTAHTVQIWGRLSSINVRKVVWAAQEAGVPFTRTDAGMAFGIVKTPAVPAMNPNALVPTLQDGDWCCGSRMSSCGTSAPSTAMTRSTRKTWRNALTPSAGWTGSRPR